MEFVSFGIGTHLFAIPVLLVQEIARPYPVYPVPGHDPRVAGLVNLRGRTAVVINCRRCLLQDCTDAADCTPRGKFIVLETEEGLSEHAAELGLHTHRESLVLAVDEVLRVVDGERLDMYEPPAHVHEHFVEGLMKVDDQLLTLISIPRLIVELMPGEDTV